MATNGKNVYLVKLGLKSFGDGRRTFARIKHLIWDQLLATKAKNYPELSCIFALRAKQKIFVIWNFCFFVSVHFRSTGNIQCAKKGITSPCNALTVINNIVFTSPEAMVEFSAENS